jgi:hypothetical protein
MSGRPDLPRNTVLRLHVTQHLAQPFVIVAARPPFSGDLADLAAPAGLTACLSHDAGIAWPDARGQALARKVLDRGGTVAFSFARLGDALACRQRLERERAA